MTRLTAMLSALPGLRNCAVPAVHLIQQVST